MLQLQLDLQPRTAQRLEKLLRAIPDQERFAENLLAYQVAEFQKSLLNLRLDLQQFEETYHLPTDEFYREFQAGIRDDREDYMVWAGLYELLCENEQRLRDLA